MPHPFCKTHAGLRANAAPAEWHRDALGFRLELGVRKRPSPGNGIGLPEARARLRAYSHSPFPLYRPPGKARARLHPRDAGRPSASRKVYTSSLSAFPATLVACLFIIHSLRWPRKLRGLMPSGWLKGKTAVITGGGRGIGRAAAELFAAEGARLFLTDRDREPLEDSAAQIRKSGGEVQWLQGTVTAADFPSPPAKRGEATFRALEVLVNNAGDTGDKTLPKVTDEEWAGRGEVNQSAHFRPVQGLVSATQGAAS